MRYHPGMDAAKITRQSKSNLALAFISLDRERRQDVTTFYAFCRVIDDIADSTEASTAEKADGLAAWREWLAGPVAGEDALAAPVRGLMAKYPITPAMLEEIITGVEMDLSPVRYETWEELRVYCHRVASAVGLVSIEIFGYRNPRCQKYAVELGLALQTTNIIRDVGKDLRLGRIYLPVEEMRHFGYSEELLRQERRNDAFLGLMKFQAERSSALYRSAAALLPPEDRRPMVAAEIMASVYRTLLERINTDGFRVFEKEYRLGRLAKGLLVLRRLLGR